MATLVSEKGIASYPETNDTSEHEVPPHEEIAERAYFIWEQNGSGDGNSEHDWLIAEQEGIQS